MVETLTACPICSHSSFKKAMDVNDYSISKEDFTIVECDSCGFHFTNPIPDLDKLGSYYESEDYISHSGTKKGIVNSIYHSVRNHTIKQKFKLAKANAQGNFSILDYGCGTGELLNYFKKQGWKTLGLEPSDSARNFGIETHGIEVKNLDALSSLKENSFQVISLWHVLEHVVELKNTIQQLKRVLKSNGTLFVAVPNHTSYDAMHYKNEWAAYDVPRHLYHFGPTDIKNLFAQFDFKVEKILPMKFDAYYVSMLSENYVARTKGKEKGSVLKGFYNGFKSNLKASNHKNDYSSQIYVLKKKK